MSNRCIMALAMAVLLAGVAQGEDLQTLTGFSVPEYDKQGNMTSQLFGDFAEFLPGGMVKISNLKIEFYDGDEVNMRITAPKCNYHQKKKEAESDSSVRISRDSMIVTGVGFKWESGRERLQIRSQARVVLKNVREKMKTGESE